MKPTGFFCIYITVLRTYWRPTTDIYIKGIWSKDAKSSNFLPKGTLSLIDFLGIHHQSHRHIKTEQVQGLNSFRKMTEQCLKGSV